MSDNTMRKRGGRARRTIALTSVTGVAAAVAIGVAVTRSDDSSRVERVAERTPVPAEPAPANPAPAEPAAEDELRVSTRGWSTDFTKHSVPLGEFFGGGPGNDSIPAIDNPVFTTTAEAGEYLEAREPVILVEINGDARIYPIQVLIWHEIVNDTLGGTPIAVTFCPLCNTALVFDRTLDGQLLPTSSAARQASRDRTGRTPTSATTMSTGHRSSQSKAKTTASTRKIGSYSSNTRAMRLPFLSQRWPRPAQLG